ncbi:MAG: T9SS type A sorting domain-containing protein [candidate division WOR-3 bacterium]|nr:T9SS type A sorting domain-containing protein [candidate division WOR-3 bacterium]
MVWVMLYISEMKYLEKSGGEWVYISSSDSGILKKVHNYTHPYPIVEKKVNPYQNKVYRKPVSTNHISDSLSQEFQITYSGTVRDVKAAYSRRIGRVVYTWSEQDPSCNNTYCLHVWREGYPYIYVFAWPGTSDPDIAIGDTNRWALISFNDAADDSLYWIYYDLIADTFSYYYWAYEPLDIRIGNTCEHWESFSVFQEPLPNGNYATFFSEVSRWWNTNNQCNYSPGQDIDSSGAYIGSFLFGGRPQVGLISGSYRNILGFMHFYENPSSDRARRISINFGRDYLYHPIAKNNNNVYFIAYELQVWRPPRNVVNKQQWIDFVVINQNRDTINTGRVANRLISGASNYISMSEDTFPAKHPDIASNGNTFTVAFTRVYTNLNNWDVSTGDYDIGRRFVAFGTNGCNTNRWCVYGGNYAARSSRREYHPRIEFDRQNYILAYGDSMFSLPSSKLRWREVSNIDGSYSDTTGRAVTNNLFRYSWGTITSSFDLVPTLDTVRCQDNTWRRVMRFVYIKTTNGTNRDVYYRRMLFTGCITPVNIVEAENKPFYFDYNTKNIILNRDEPLKIYDVSGKLIMVISKRGKYELNHLNKGIYFINRNYKIVIN